VGQPNTLLAPNRGARWFGEQKSRLGLGLRCSTAFERYMRVIITLTPAQRVYAYAAARYAM